MVAHGSALKRWGSGELSLPLCVRHPGFQRLGAGESPLVRHTCSQNNDEDFEEGRHTFL